MQGEAAMAWLEPRMKWILLVSGVLTCTMVYAAIEPGAALHSTFGSSLEGPVADVVVRNWGALIALMGGMMIYAAYRPAVRPMVALVAGAGKVIFIALVLSHGQAFLDDQAGVAVLVDSVIVALLGLYLLGRIRSPAPVSA
jgi:hypothetical protein